jgi:CHASE2 domain-containing sensor protein
MPILPPLKTIIKTVLQKSWEWRTGAVLIASLMGARWLGAFAGLELVALDFLLRHRAPEGKDETIAIVLIKQAGTIEERDSFTDQQIIELLDAVFAAKPAVVGLHLFRNEQSDDPHRPQLIELFKRHENLFGLRKTLPPNQVEPIFKAPVNQFGISDLPVDQDGRIRRVFIVAYLPDDDQDPKNNPFQFSFSFKLAEYYLAQKGFLLKNSKTDPAAPSFIHPDTKKEVSIPRITPHFGGYVREKNIPDVQTLLKFRAGQDTFEILDADTILSSPERRKALADKIVIIGALESFPPRLVPVAVASNLQQQSGDILPQSGIPGAELEAHAVSQLIQAVEGDRPLIRTTHPILEDFVMALAGVAGVVIGIFVKSTMRKAFLLIIGGGLFFFLCWGVLYHFGFWVPIVSTITGFAITGMTYLGFHYQSQRSQIQSQELALTEVKVLEKERRKAIEHAFNTIHAGPLQRLSRLLRYAKDSADPHNPENTFILEELDALNKEIRSIGDRLRQEAIEDVYFIVSDSDIKLDLTHPMHEILYEVYSLCVQRKLPGFSKIKVRSVSISPFNCKSLDLDVKRQLCWFLEESLQNIGKHAMGTTKIQVIGKNISNCYSLKVEDNGPGITTSHIGAGTEAFYRLEAILQGKFFRFTKPGGGTVCELIWPSAFPP